MLESKAMAAELKIYTWSTCPFCVRAKALLDSKNISYEEISLDGKEDERMALAQKTGQTSVPQIFINGEFKGGCDDLHALDASGELDKLLA